MELAVLDVYLNFSGVMPIAYAMLLSQARLAPGLLCGSNRKPTKDWLAEWQAYRQKLQDKEIGEVIRGAVRFF